MNKTKWVVYTAVCLALLLCLQFVTKSLGQFVTGSCVNLLLATAVIIGGPASGIAVALASPFCAYLLGIGPAFLQLVPCVAAGNLIFVILVALLSGKAIKNRMRLNAFLGMIPAAAAKFAVLYLLIVKLVAPTIIPAAKLSVVTAAFSWPQLVTALIGGLLSVLVLPPVLNGLNKKAV